jgi:2,4-dienoyl-CoA reductase-like NADH-dependent reductase (Old Yellow Enzyme family)
MGSMHRDWKRGLMAYRLAAFYAERARGAALIVTGGFSPSDAGNLSPHRAQFSTKADVNRHRHSQAVHDAGVHRAAAPALGSASTTASSLLRPSSRRSIHTRRAR